MTESLQPNTFGQAMTEHREATGLTQVRAARLAGVSQSRWNQIERGYESRSGFRSRARPTRTTVAKIANAIEWDLAEALTLAGYDPSEAIEVPAPNGTVTYLTLWRDLGKNGREAILRSMWAMSHPHADPADYPEDVAS